jgi:hypothetical protein
MYSQFVPHAQPNIYNDLQSPQMAMPNRTFQQPQMFPGPQTPSIGSDRNVYVDNEHAENLSDVLGELKIDESGIGMAHCPSTDFPATNG